MAGIQKVENAQISETSSAKQATKPAVDLECNMVKSNKNKFKYAKNSMSSETIMKIEKHLKNCDSCMKLISGNSEAKENKVENKPTEEKK